MIDAVEGLAEVDRRERRNVAIIDGPCQPLDSVNQGVLRRVTRPVRVLSRRKYVVFEQV